MVSNRIYVLHEYGIPEHYKGLVYLEGEKDFTIHYYNFRFCKDFVKAIYKIDRIGLYKSLKSFSFFLSCFLWPGRLKNKVVVLGCAPIDWRFMFLLRALNFDPILI